MPFFQTSGLSSLQLGDIWGMADAGSKGYLVRSEFDDALKLIAQCQAQQPPSVGAVDGANIPAFDGFQPGPLTVKVCAACALCRVFHL